MKKLNQLILYLMLAWLAGCQRVYIFQPVQSAYFENIWFDDVNIKFESFQVYGYPQLARIKLQITNNDEKEFVMKDSIEIIGTYFYSFRVDKVGLDDLLTDEVDGIVLKDQPFKFKFKKFAVELPCFLNDKLTAKERFSGVIKKERFKVKLPTLIIDGKEYEFETVDFVYKNS